MVRVLLSLELDHTLREVLYGRALIQAAHMSHEEIVCLLLGRGFDTNAIFSVETEIREFPGRIATALSTASYRGDMKMVRMLLDNGADVNASRLRVSALEQAALNGHMETVKILLVKGSEIHGALLGSAFYGSEPIVKLLLSHGADVNFCGSIEVSSARHDGNALSMAARCDHTDVLNYC
jgi:ankyrin repeat protein